jgi:cysteine synthase A
VRSPPTSLGPCRNRASTPSSGATFAAVKVAESAPEGSVIIAMLPDTGERYLSTMLFEGINEGSDEEWLAALG